VEPEALRAVISANIRRLADARSITLPVLADLAGLARGAFYRVVNAEASATSDTLAKIAAVLEVPPRELLDERLVKP
jgi:transcriptional regulator with XRE-family HTH domain